LFGFIDGLNSHLQLAALLLERTPLQPQYARQLERFPVQQFLNPLQGKP